MRPGVAGTDRGATAAGLGATGAGLGAGFGGGGAATNTTPRRQPHCRQAASGLQLRIAKRAVGYSR